MPTSFRTGRRSSRTHPRGLQKSRSNDDRNNINTSPSVTRPASHDNNADNHRIYDAPYHLDATEVAATDNFSAIERQQQQQQQQYGSPSSEESYTQLLNAFGAESSSELDVASGNQRRSSNNSKGKSGGKNDSDDKKGNENSSSDKSRPSAAKLRFLKAAKKIQQMNSNATPLQQATQTIRSQRLHRSSPSQAHDLLQSIQGTSEVDGIFRDASHDVLYAAAGVDSKSKKRRISNGMDDDDNSDEVELMHGHYHKNSNITTTGTGNDNLYHATDDNGEVLPLRQDSKVSQRYGSVMADSLHRNHSTMPGGNSKSSKLLSCCRKFCQNVKQNCSPQHLCRLVSYTVTHSFFFWIGLPLECAAWVLYYLFGNPELDFLPGHATLAWWCNFFARQVAVLELARFAQWILIDCLVLGIRFSVKLVGPLITLLAIQARGWPFILVAWSVFDMGLLHGDNPFQLHWFYWTGLNIYSLETANSGSYVINSTSYMHVLLAGLFAGMASALKRLMITVKFSKRQCLEFKPRLEKLLAEIILVTEIAVLADNADLLVAAASEDSDENMNESGDSAIGKITSSGSKVDLLAPRRASNAIADVHWGSISYYEPHFQFSDDDAQARDSASTVPESNSTSTSGNNSAPVRRSLSTTSSGSFKIKEMLDRWEVPVNKAEKTEVSISDVLKFKRALAFMDHDFPFGREYGLSNSRDACISSANSVYERLLKLSPGDALLSFDILELLLVDDDGNIDQDKKLALRRLFRPDRHNKLTSLAFIQTCDNVYKRLRYFRASVGNSSVIDNVLEGMFDGMFYFVLALLLASLLQFNPWTLLVSITSLLVSISFALGPSVSKYVEGVLLIAIRRPYDLGDRIFIGGSEVPPAGDVSSNTAFVEDITLTTTTLRYARTNEVSTVNNWAIAASRIVNCNRSPNAIVFLDAVLHISVLEGNNLAKYVGALKDYVRDNPRTWDSLAFCRHDAIEANLEQVYFTIAFRHRNSWQDAARIKLNRADLVRFLYDTAKKLKISYESPPPVRVIYQGGELEDGEIPRYKKDLVGASNIRKYSAGSVTAKLFEASSLGDDNFVGESTRRIMEGD